MSLIVVVGGGPAGSVCAARLAQRKHRVLVLEREPFPRFRIGESLLPASLPILDEVGVLPQLEARFIRKCAAQFHDDRVDAHTRFPFSAAFDSRFDHAFQVPRDAFDEVLLEHARSLGAEVRHGWTVTRLVEERGRTIGVEARRPDGSVERLEASFVFDATGRDALTAHHERATERIPGLDQTAFFAHLEDVHREQGVEAGDIHIILANCGWLWVIPFRDGRTSLGAVVTRAWLSSRRPGEDPDQLLRRAIDESANASRIVRGARFMWPARSAADFSFRVAQRVAPGRFSIGDAGGFIDPLFSTGVHLAIFGGYSAADALDVALRSPSTSAAPLDALEACAERLARGTEVFVLAVRAFYAGRLQPYLFATETRSMLRRSITSLLSGDVFGDEIWIRDVTRRLRELVTEADATEVRSEV